MYRKLKIQMWGTFGKLIAGWLQVYLVTSDNSCVHTSLVSRPEVYLKFTSDANRSNCSVSRLLCGRGNDFSSKEPKYTSK